MKEFIETVSPLTPDKKIIFDWYDGIVCALIKFFESENWCFIKLEAVDLAIKSRVYSLQVLTDKDQKLLLDGITMYQPSWPIWVFDHSAKSKVLEGIVERYISLNNTVNYVFFSEGLDNNKIVVKKISKALPKKVGIEEIYNMSQHEIDSWFDK